MLLAEGELASARAARNAAMPVKPATSVASAEALLLGREHRRVGSATRRGRGRAKILLPDGQTRRDEAATALEAARADAIRLDLRAASLEKALSAALRQATSLRATDGDCASHGRPIRPPSSSVVLAR